METASPIEINVKTHYIADQSDPTDHRFVYAYTITIRNQSDVPTKLISRHWLITNGNNELQEVRGDGVVGEQPHLSPGDEYTYTSGVVLETETGTMEGSYQMVTDDGRAFDARTGICPSASPRYTLRHKQEMTTYAVGDLQGCLDPLLCLLDEVNFQPGPDQCGWSGDLVNRGPKSLETLEFLYSIREHVVAVLGNHDLHLIAHAYGFRAASRGDTLAPILASPSRDKLLHWLRSLPLVHWDAQLGYAMAHAGIPPQWSVKQALEHSQEVSAYLQDDSKIKEYLASMYGNEPAQWNDGLAGMARLRLITNYFTRMRFCNADGLLDFSNKGHPEQAPEGFQPWFEHYLDKSNNPPVIFGHWASLDGETRSNRAIGLDNGCVWGNRMTLLSLDSGRRWQCHCQG